MSLKVRKLSKTFSTHSWRKRSVLQEVDFEVPSKSITGFVGLNGSGKTTTIKCLFDFVHPDSGEILFFEDLKLSKKVKKRLAYLPERPYLPDTMSAQEFLRLHWRLSGGVGDFKEQLNSVLQRVDLRDVEKRRIRTFSKGMLQRLSLAQVLIHPADLLILDEPMSGLDPDGRALVKQVLREEHARGASILFSSHLLADMDELCSHVVIMHEGKIPYHGPLSGFTDSTVEAGFFNAINRGRR